MRQNVKPTQDPVPSSNIKDLFFNSGLLDIWATSLEHKYIDRFGNCHLTAAGMEWIFNELVSNFNVDAENAIKAAGYVTADSFQEGFNVTEKNQVLRWKEPDGDGEYYRWDGEYPKLVPLNSTPSSSGGVGKGAWLSVGDASLRGELSTWKGASLIDGGNLTVFKKHGQFGDGGTVNTVDQAIQDSDGFWYIYTGTFPHKYGESHTDDDEWVNVGLLNGHPVNSVENYGAVPSEDVFDNSDAINRCIQANFILGRTTVIGEGTFKVAKPINLLMGSNYKFRGTNIIGQGIGATILESVGDSTAGVIQTYDETGDRYNVNLSGFSVHAKPNNIACIDFRVDFSRVNLKNLRLVGAQRQINITKKAWVNSFTDMFLSGGDYGIYMGDSGTTNTFDEIFVYGCKVTAYKLSTIYSNIGSLAADECTGKCIYDFRYSSGLSVGSLGFEEPSGQYPELVVNLDNTTNVTIESIVSWNGTPTDGDTQFDVVFLGNAAGAKIGGVYLTDTRGASPINGRLIKGYNGNITLGDVVLRGVSFKPSTPLRDSSLMIRNNGTVGSLFKREFHKPIIAGGNQMPQDIGFSTAMTSRVIPTIYGDSLSSPALGSNNMNDRELPAPNVGDRFYCNDPAKYGVAEYVCISKGTMLADSKFGFVPCIVSSATPPDSPARSGVQWWDTGNSRLRTWNGSAWVP